MTAVAEAPVTRVAALDWQRAARDLDARGSAVLERLLAADQCESVAALYSEDRPFRAES